MHGPHADRSKQDRLRHSNVGVVSGVLTLSYLLCLPALAIAMPLRTHRREGSALQSSGLAARLLRTAAPRVRKDLSQMCQASGHEQEERSPAGFGAWLGCPALTVRPALTSGRRAQDLFLQMCQASEHDTLLLRMLRQHEASQVRLCVHGTAHLGMLEQALNS